MTWAALLKRAAALLSSPWVWGGLFVLSVLALLTGWHLYHDYRAVAEHAYTHPALAHTVTKHHYHTRTVVGPEHIKTVHILKYLRNGTTEVYDSIETARAASIVDTSSTTVSSATVSTPVAVPVVAVSSSAVTARWYGWLGWTPGLGLAGVQYVPARIPVTGAIGLTTSVNPYLAIGMKFH